MKRIIGIILIILGIIIPINVKAEDAYIAQEYLNDYVYIKNASVNKKIQIQKHIVNNSSNKLGYTLDLWDDTVLDNQTLNKVKLIAYYGYGYDKHTDIKWYSITQYVIWNFINKNSDITFVDNVYSNEIKELEMLVSSYELLPSFANYSNIVTSDTKNITLTDTNNVLSNYILNNNDGLSVNTKNNSVIINGPFVRDHNILFITKPNYMYVGQSEIYDNYFLLPGSMIKKFSTTINFPKIYFKFKLRDKDTNSFIDDLIGTKIRIGSDVITFTMDGMTAVKPFGTYNVSFESVPEGYKTPDDFIIDIDDNNKEKTIYLEKVSLNEIDVPNTYLKKEPNYYLIYILLIVIGILLIGKKKYEKD